jgi:hypothetical protein
MIIGAKDRSDYRMQYSKNLIDEAKYNPNPELCIVLAERLQDALDALELEGVKLDF